MLERLPDVTGLVVHNEVALPAVLAGLRERGIEVPRDMSVVAVCPQDVATGQPQQLTAVDIPATRIGAVAVEMVMARLDDGQTRRDAPARPRAHVPRSTTAAL